MVAEIPALKFKLDVHALPSSGRNSPQGLAVGKSLLHRFNHVAQIFRQHSKQQHDALLVDRFMAQRAEVDRVAVRRRDP